MKAEKEELCAHYSVEILFQGEGSCKDAPIIPRYIANAIRNEVPISALISEIFSVIRVFLPDRCAEREINIYYHVVGVTKIVELPESCEGVRKRNVSGRITRKRTGKTSNISLYAYEKFPYIFFKLKKGEIQKILKNLYMSMMLPHFQT